MPSHSSKSNAMDTLDSYGFLAKYLKVFKKKTKSVSKKDNHDAIISNETFLDRPKRLVLNLKKKLTEKAKLENRRNLAEYDNETLLASGAFELPEEDRVFFRNDSSNQYLSGSLALMNHSDFAKELLVGYKGVFRDLLLQQKTSFTKDREDVLAFVDNYDLTTVSQQNAFLATLFSAEKRKEKFGDVQANMIHLVVQGNSACVQGTPYLGWRQSGFGFLSYFFCSKLSLLLLPLVQSKIQSKYKATYVPVGPCGIIFKPSLLKGGSLNAHVDSFSYSLLLDMTKKYVEAPNKTTTDWCREHGIQSLLHFTGAEGKGGFTQVISPLDPQRFFMCLFLMSPKNKFFKTKERGYGYCSDTTFEKEEGPIMFEWFKEEVLAKMFNFMIDMYDKKDIRYLNSLKSTDQELLRKVIEHERKKYPERDDFIASKLRVIALRPSEKKIAKLTSSSALSAPSSLVEASSSIVPQFSETPYLIAWPRGFPHGSQTSNGFSRLSFSFNMEEKSLLSEESMRKQTRFLFRLFAMADLIYYITEYGDGYSFLVPLQQDSLSKFKETLVKKGKNIKRRPDHSVFEGADALWFCDFIEGDKPYADGLVHSKPFFELKLLPYYHHLYAKREDIIEFMDKMNLTFRCSYLEYERQQPLGKLSTKAVSKATRKHKVSSLHTSDPNPNPNPDLDNQSIQSNKSDGARKLNSTTNTQDIGNVKIKGLFSISSAYVPSIMAGRNKYINRNLSSQTGYYGLLATTQTDKMGLQKFLDKHVEEKEVEQETRSMIKHIDEKVVGIIHIKKIYYRGDTTVLFPIDAYADGPYAYNIEFIPISNYIDYEHKQDRMNNIIFPEDTKKKLNDELNSYLLK